MIRPFIIQKVIFPLVDLFTKRKFWGIYQKSLASQWMSEEQIKSSQISKLKKLLVYSYENVPFYREIFDSVHFDPHHFKQLSDMEKLPIITKKDLQSAGLEKTSSKKLNELNYYKDSTSGSTGEPFSFLGEYAHRDISTAFTIRGYSWTGYSPGDPMLLLWGYHHANLPTKVYKFLLNQTFVSAFEIEKNFDNIIKTIEKTKPKLAVCYASAIVQLAKMCEEKGVNDIKIPSIITSAETLYDEHRSLIERIFSARVFNRYGSRELGEIAHECDAHQGLHISEENLFIEFVPFEHYPDWKRIIATHLDKRAMPLIRYDTGDLGIPSEKSCSCGRKLTLIKEINGRNTDFLTLQSGKRIPFLFFNYTFEQYGPYVKGFQIVQEDSSKLTIKIIPSENYSEDIGNKLIDKLSEELTDTEMRIEKVPEIPLSKAGKKITVLTKKS